MKILVSVLDWGLGHATRTSALVGRLVAEGNDVVLAGSGKSIAMLCNDYPQLRCLKLKSFSPFFFRYLPQWVAITLQVPCFLLYIFKEWWQVHKIIAKEKFDMIISDNRYGVRNKKSCSILLTHQLSPIVAMWAPEFINTLFARCLSIFINRFDEVWVPDIADFPNGLAGRLADPRFVKIKVKTIGLLSRLEKRSDISASVINHLAIISGPEPQRTMFENEINQIFARSIGVKKVFNGVGYISAEELSMSVQQAQQIYCRSGYSTIMDLVKMGKKAKLKPTKGQAEQEYLAERMCQFGFSKLEN